MSAVAYALDGEIAVLTVDWPPVNALSSAVRVAMGEALTRARDDPAVRAVVLLGAGKTFIAGADITEMGTDKSAVKPGLIDLQNVLERFPKLVVAAIHGTALGGGLELALTAHARVAVASAKLGLPEVALGLLPGAGGTQRLPRLTGVEVALELVTSGKHISAARAMELGIVDALVDEVRAGGIDFARTALRDERRFIPVIERNEKLCGIGSDIFSEFRTKTVKKARGKIAPLAIIDCIEAATRLPAVEALDYERACFRELFASDQRGALMHYFFAEREARKVSDMPPGTVGRPIASAAVIGSGTMGGGIAMVFANAGIPVTLVDIDEAAL
ncbi:MAG: enoyl-CoA hydratase-related protein, partial [Sphingomicrobium sp.]